MSNNQKIQKIKVQCRTDDQLLEQCNMYGECSITWISPQKGEQIIPPKDTVAVVVDVPENKGAIRIFEMSGSDKRIGAVGTEDAGHKVIIPWDGKWWFRVSGSPTVGYIQRLDDRSMEEPAITE